MRAFVGQNGFHLNGDQTDANLSSIKSRIFTLEGNFLAMEAIQEMLLQGWGGTLRVFPAVSEKWSDASFENLRAQGALVVSARRQAGQTIWVRIRALADSPLRLRDPFDGRRVTWNLPGVKKTGRDYEYTLPAGVVLFGQATVRGTGKQEGSQTDASSNDSNQKFSKFGKELKKIKYLPRVPQLLSHGEKIAIKLLVGLIILSSIALGVQYYFNNTVVVAKSGGDYIEGLVGEPKFINPIFSDAANEIEQSITSLTFRGLMSYDKDLSLEHDIAERFEQSKDKKQYTFYLQQEIKWHDAEKQTGLDQFVTADDVVFTIKAIQDKDYASPLRANFEGVNVEKVDDYTVRFTLEDAFSPFLS